MKPSLILQHPGIFTHTNLNNSTPKQLIFQKPKTCIYLPTVRIKHIYNIHISYYLVRKCIAPSLSFNPLSIFLHTLFQSLYSHWFCFLLSKKDCKSINWVQAKMMLESIRSSQIKAYNGIHIKDTYHRFELKWIKNSL